MRWPEAAMRSTWLAELRVEIGERDLADAADDPRQRAADVVPEHRQLAASAAGGRPALAPVQGRIEDGHDHPCARSAAPPPGSHGCNLRLKPEGRFQRTIQETVAIGKRQSHLHD